MDDELSGVDKFKIVDETALISIFKCFAGKEEFDAMSEGLIDLAGAIYRCQMMNTLFRTNQYGNVVLKGSVILMFIDFINCNYDLIMQLHNSLVLKTFTKEEAEKVTESFMQMSSGNFSNEVFKEMLSRFAKKEESNDE